MIEDNILIADITADFLNNNGATSFDFALTEDAAVEASLARRPDVIISDVELAIGTGPSAVCKIRRHYGQIPVIFLTGVPEKCRDIPSSVILRKPMSQRDLIAAFHAVVPA